VEADIIRCHHEQKKKKNKRQPREPEPNVIMLNVPCVECNLVLFLDAMKVSLSLSSTLNQRRLKNDSSF
jgi:hypothetical protein